MVTTLRLPAETETLLRRMSHRTGKSKSAVIREAIALLAEREAASTKRTRPYEAIAHLVGCVDSGGRELSEQTGKQLTELLRARRARRAR